MMTNGCACPAEIINTLNIKKLNNNLIVFFIFIYRVAKVRFFCIFAAAFKTASLSSLEEAKRAKRN
jgi:hypothetical protein